MTGPHGSHHDSAHGERTVGHQPYGKRVGTLKNRHELIQEVESLRARLSKLGEVSLRINQSFDCDCVLHEVVDSACVITNARYGVIATCDHWRPDLDFPNPDPEIKCSATLFQPNVLQVLLRTRERY